MKAAAATNDIATVIRLMTSASALKPTDFIKKTVGNLMFMYYVYIDTFHVRPVDVDDWIDGLLYIDAKQYLIKQETAKAQKE